LREYLVVRKSNEIQNMEQDTVKKMSQRVLNLITIMDAHKDGTAEEIMGGLIVLVDSLVSARSALRDVLKEDKDPGRVLDILQPTMIPCTKYGADDLFKVTQRAQQNLMAAKARGAATLDGPAAADVSVWISVAEQTIVAAKILFQTSYMLGRAPNGKKLAL